MKRKITAAILAALLSVSLLSGCGGTGREETTGKQAEQAAEESAEKNAEESVEETAADSAEADTSFSAQSSDASQKSLIGVIQGGDGGNTTEGEPASAGTTSLSHFHESARVLAVDLRTGDQ